MTTVDVCAALMASRIAHITAIALLLATLAAEGLVHDYTLNIKAGDVSPDGFTRIACLVNGQFPGTLITGNKGDFFRITVNNMLNDDRLDKPTAIHWHGLLQASTSHNDGPAGVTQCPIVPGGSYTYEFSAADQAGTFWYHSHFGAQYVDGCRGAFIVYDPNDPRKGAAKTVAAGYDMDDASTVLQLSDWYRKPSHQLVGSLLTTGKEPIPDSGLINGKGGTSTSYSLPVTKGKRYRLRIINTSAMSSFRFSIDQHTFTVIEADGVDTRPVRASSLEIYPGQRYSVVLNANQAAAKYYIRTKMFNGPGGIETLAVLQYTGVPPTAPVRSSDTGGSNRLDERSLSPTFFDRDLMDPSVPADITVNLKYTKTGGVEPGKVIWTFNGVTYKPPPAAVNYTALLYSVLTNSSIEKAGDFYANSGVVVLNHTQKVKKAIVDFTIEGSANGFKHPFHLHGHVFSVLGYADEDKLSRGIGPVMRDVHPIGGSRETLRFRADNPGVWFMHCHIDWHIEGGLGIVFAEHLDELRKNVPPPPPEWFNTCAEWMKYAKATGVMESG